MTLITPNYQRESDLLATIKSTAEAAASLGWETTKRAMGATLPREKRNLTNDAKLAYSVPLLHIAQGTLIESSSPNFQRELALTTVGVNINVFDLYRRVGELDKATELGKQTLDDAVRLADTPTTLRAGNFFTLVNSAKAYELVNEGKYTQALSAHHAIEETFSSMPFDQAEGKNAVMLNSNRSANYVQMVRVAKMGELDINVDPFLENASLYALESSVHLSELSEQDQANWVSNIEYNLGFANEHQGNMSQAVDHYKKSLAASNESAFTAQKAGVQVSLANALAQNSATLEEARAHYQDVQDFLSKESFGIYDGHLMPTVDALRERLG